jgi:3-hydroxybutyrate dehydrogenase
MREAKIASFGCIVSVRPGSRKRDVTMLPILLPDIYVATQQKHRAILLPHQTSASTGRKFACSTNLNLGVAMLKGKSALVTGSTSGIGLAIARALAAQGANITINGFGDKAAIEKERSGIESEFKVKAAYSAADMSKAGEIADMVHASEKTFGSLDVLVNNAGIQFVAPIEEFPIEKWDQIISINLSAAFHTCRAAVPGMKSRKWGRIINTASAHSLVASPFKVAYVSAKHGLAGLTKTVALEVATFGVTCNCISPGYVWTPLVEKQIPDTMKARNMTAEQVKRDVLLAAQPTKEFVTVEQVADLAVYLCSDAAKSITGANLSIDGGWTAE